MQRLVQSQINMKKSAFRTQIRRQWLDNYFQQKRTQLMKLTKLQSQYEDALNIKLSQLLNNLPQTNTINELINEYTANKSVVIKFMKNNVVKFTDTIKQLSLKGFNIYILILSGIVVTYPQARTDILNLSMKRMLHQGKRMMKQQKLVSHIIMMNLVEFILVLSQCFDKMDQFLMFDTCDILTEALSYIDVGIDLKQIQQCYIQTLQIINQYLMASVNGVNQQEEQQNIDQDDFYNLQFLKDRFISKMFRERPQNIKIIIQTASMLPDLQRIGLMTLKVLTNLTYQTNDQTIYKCIFELNIQHLVFSILASFSRKQHILIILIRLINNLLLCRKQLSQSVYKNMSFRHLIKAFNRQKYGKITLTEQFCQMITHLIFYMEESKSFIQYFINQNIVDVLIYGCQNITKNDILFQVLVCLPMLMNVQEQAVTIKIRQFSNVFQKIIQIGEDNSIELAKNLLQASFKDNNIQNDMLFNPTEQKDIEI